LLVETADGTSILVDCGPDFKRQTQRFHVDRVDELLLTHEHADHVNGLDELRIYNFKQKAAIPVHGMARTLGEIRDRWRYVFNPIQQGGGLPQFTLIERLPMEEFFIGGISIVPLPYRHGILDISGYLFGGRFAYMTDCSEIPQSTFERVKGVDVLVLGALRPKEHPTHFNIRQATAAAQAIGAHRVLFTHMTHDVLHERDNATLPAPCAFAYDGQVLDFPARDGARP